MILLVEHCYVFVVEWGLVVISVRALLSFLSAKVVNILKAALLGVVLPFILIGDLLFLYLVVILDDLLKLLLSFLSAIQLLLFTLLAALLVQLILRLWVKDQIRHIVTIVLVLSGIFESLRNVSIQLQCSFLCLQEPLGQHGAEEDDQRAIDLVARVAPAVGELLI